MSDSAFEHFERLVRTETEVSGLKEDVKEIRDDLKAMRIEQAVALQEIRSTLDQAKGGWKAGLLFAGAASAIGSVIGWVVSHFKLL